jgi:hypothetical protein
MDSVTEEGAMALSNSELKKKLSGNPRFKPAKKSGRAYVIPGVKPRGAAQQLPEESPQASGPK